MNHISVRLTEPMTFREHPCLLCKDVIPEKTKTVHISAHSQDIARTHPTKNIPWLSGWVHMECWQKHLDRPKIKTHPAIHVARTMWRIGR